MFAPKAPYRLSDLATWESSAQRVRALKAQMPALGGSKTFDLTAASSQVRKRLGGAPENPIFASLRGARTWRSNLEQMGSL